jgi:peptidoglycan/xylan/chitin deacetylase (PgdA/CDA1 family)
MTAARRGRLVKRLKLAALAVAGLCTVSIPVTIAFVMSATGSSDVLTIGRFTPRGEHATPATAIARLRCRPTRGYYALTFDDGPLAASTPRLVAALERAQAVGTFFDVGARAARRPDLVELQRRVGQVASHGYSGVSLGDLSDTRRIEELQATARIIDYPNAFVRPPGGARDPRVAEDLRRSGLIEVAWTVDGDERAAPADVIVARALSLQPGGILRLHDGHEPTIAALGRIVTGLGERGLCPGFLRATGTTVRAVKP